ncbi:uncharacterized protein LOC130139591 [Syzygium oleosum]|uniref:uncharacterized protein LOC130139591 n=1 Tax=Syzygium oleosum TaxID=219896 RepID=UPI0024BBD31B|nr:uncharacterized protein LOC130139591 [Syzygium oleosum]
MASPATSTPTSPSSKRSKRAPGGGGDDERRPPTEEGGGDGVRCGICLTEGGRAVRGRIDSCDHHFCFVCIMEWAKVESKCPMCKRRFSTILRPPKDGVFAAERIVNVPPRDQVYDPHGIRPFDPYTETRCGVCRGTQDEWCLLLCELCDSAFHTYCVGLGVTVPQGDWFCHDCAFMRDEHARTDEGESCVGHVWMLSTELPVSIFDIVRDSRASNIARPTTTVSSPLDLSAAVSERGDDIVQETSQEGERRDPNVAERATEYSGARTLQRCRDVHLRIKAFRENWDALRGGSLSFHSGNVESLHSESSERDHHNSGHNRLGQPSSSHQPLKDEDSMLDFASHHEDKYDITKAWKMMDRAKSRQQARDLTSSVCHVANKFVRKGNTPKVASLNINHLALRNRVNKSRYTECAAALQHKVGHVGDKSSQHKSPVTGRQKQKRCPGLPPSPLDQASLQRHEYHTNKSVRTSSSITYQEDNCRSLTSSAGSVSGSSKPRSPVIERQKQKRCPGFPPSIMDHASLQRHECHTNKSVRTSCSVTYQEDNWPSLTSSAGSASVSSNCFSATLGASVASSQNSQGKGMLEEPRVAGHSRRDDSAKSEIQSLVKFNLKMLSCNKQLGVDAFKEIARAATHTILAACGLEWPKSVIPSSVCCHTDDVQRLHKSTLMPNSCRECFYAYVKTIVDTLLLEKLSKAN